MPALPDAAGFDLPPDWICEIVSPSTALLDRTRKLPLYARAGVPHAWLVDPIARKLEVLRLEQGRWTVLNTYGGMARVTSEPFEDMPLDLAVLWDEAG